MIMPMFPISMVVFPGELVNLHIFEPRYKQLIHEADASDIHFGILPYFEGKDLLYATEVKLAEISNKYEDGKMDVKLQALNVVKILDFFPVRPGRLYPGSEIETLPYFDNFDIELNGKIIKNLLYLYETMNIENITLKGAMEFRTHQIAHKVGFSIDQELEFMMFTNEKLRAEFMLKHLDHFIPQVLEMERLRKRAELNGHFQHFDVRDL
ncbi:MAG: LON peptidase substrate-binding domain-containing protein [Saprospiraceae bacterium]